MSDIKSDIFRRQAVIFSKEILKYETLRRSAVLDEKPHLPKFMINMDIKQELMNISNKTSTLSLMERTYLEFLDKYSYRGK